jgi:Family of unknown function (DUF6088)
MQTIKKQILARVKRLGPGRAFVAKDFLDLASRGSIDMALSALVRENVIRRVRRGLYDLPKTNPDLGGALSPDIDQTAQALARRYRWTIVPEGTWAANLLGLSTQVPAKIIYLSDGPNQKVSIGRRTISFKHARPNVLGKEKGTSALVIQALRYLGKKRIDQTLISRLHSLLSEADKQRLLKATRFGVDWIYKAAQKIVEESL